MSIWAKFFGRTAPRPGLPSAQEGESEGLQSPMHGLLANETNWRLVREAIERLEAAGLRIYPTLDREVIVVRSLCGLANWCEGDDPVRFFADQEHAVARNSLDLLLLLDLASETDDLYGLEDIDIFLPKYSSLPDEELHDLVSNHSVSIFENASSVCIVNDDEPGDYIRHKLQDLTPLACGDFTVRSVTETKRSNRLAGRVVLSDGQSVSFEIDDEKRPDLTPLFKSVNSLIAPLNKGRFVTVLTGNSEDVIALYLHPNEQAAFLHWAQQQHYANGSILGDWIK
jgi:hypothetical protein